MPSQSTQTLQNSTKEAAIRKIFICYASENIDLLKDFVKRLQEHYGEMDLLFDGTPYSGNLHKRFQRFATECDIAILLVNARFTNFESYATKYEMPVLLKRLKRHEVTIIGVLFSDVDVETWNKEGDIYFFQLRNGGLTRTRRHDENADHFHTQFAVYETIAKEDRNTFHKELVKWINQSIESTAIERAEYIKSNPESAPPNAIEVSGERADQIRATVEKKKKPPPKTPENLPRSTVQSEKIINKIHDPFLRALEVQLSMRNDYWNDFELTPEQKGGPLMPVFFERQCTKIKMAREGLGLIDDDAATMLDVRLKKIIPEIDDARINIKNLLNALNEKDQDFNEILSNLEDQLTDIRSSLKLVHRPNVRERLQNDSVPELFESLTDLTEKMQDLDKKMYRYMRN